MLNRRESQGLRLLALDGGGIRGMSELLILEEILKRIKNRLGLKEVPLPCDYFDMIGGTSTGGLIALMLGRLGMSVGDAVDCYGALSGEVFREVKPIGHDGRFKSSKLKEVIQKIVKNVAKDTEELMMNPEFVGRQCKTFVCTKPALSLGGKPHLFRSYQAPKYETVNCTIWEAARATSAAPTFFKRIVIGGSKGTMIPYIDGGMGCNNPTAQVLEEAKLVFPGQEVHCLVSIGAGQAHTISISRPNFFQRFLPTDVISALRGIATDCEATAQDIARRFQGRPNVYFRFNVEQGLQDIGLEHWERLDEVTTHTAQYMRRAEVDQKLDSLALAIQGKPAVAAIFGTQPSKTPIQFKPVWFTTFDHKPHDAAESQLYYPGIVPHRPLKWCRSSVGNGAFSIRFNGSDPVRWMSILDADLVGPVRVETTVDLSRCKTTNTPSGAGVLVILPDEGDDRKARKFFFIVEPSDLVPQLHVLKQDLKPAYRWPFKSLHSQILSHCQGQQKVQVEVVVLDGTISVSTNGVASPWVLRMPTSRGPNPLRAFGLCGIGPQRLTWTSFKVSVAHDQPLPTTDSEDEDSEADTPYLQDASPEIPLSVATKISM